MHDHEIGEHEGRHFIAMELLDGELSRMVRRPLDSYRLIEFAIEIADGSMPPIPKGSCIGT
jgi:hypothetical protein